MDMANVRRQIFQLPDTTMAKDIDEILAWMEDDPDPPRWLTEYPKVVSRLSFWIGQLQATVRNHETQLARIKGELDLQVRSDLIQCEDKITEDKVRRQIYGHVAHGAQADIIAACKGVLTFLRGLRTAWNPDLLVQMSVNWRVQGEVQ